MKLKLFFILAAAILTACVGDDEPQGADLKVGDMVPSLSVTLSDGTVFDNATMAGKTAVIVFFNTSCGDCQRELPVLQSHYEQVKDDPDIAWVCIAREESDESIARYWAAHGLTMPYSPQSTRHIYNLFATTDIPRVYTIDPTGRITTITAP